MDGLFRQVVSIADSQFGFVPGTGTTDAIFVVRNVSSCQQETLTTFVDLEKAFDRVPRKVNNLMGTEETWCG